MARARVSVNKSFEEKTISKRSPAEVETTGPRTKNGTVVNALHVKVRKAASPESEVVEVVSKGARVTILEKTGEYYKVSTSSNSEVYIASNFIEIEEE